MCLRAAAGVHFFCQAPFNASACKAVCSQMNGAYKCAGNFFWQDVLWVANPRVPINTAQVKGIQKFWLPPEDCMTHDANCYDNDDANCWGAELILSFADLRLKARWQQGMGWGGPAVEV